MLARNQEAELRRHNPAFGIMPQIAQRMGRSVPSVASLLRRGLEDLRKQLRVEPQ
jgi:hypothetical protein